MSERVVSEWLLSAQSLKMNRFTFYYDRFWQDDNLIYVIMIHNMCICVGTVTLWERERKKCRSLLQNRQPIRLSASKLFNVGLSFECQFHIAHVTFRPTQQYFHILFNNKQHFHRKNISIYRLKLTIQYPWQSAKHSNNMKTLEFFCVLLFIM